MKVYTCIVEGGWYEDRYAILIAIEATLEAAEEKGRKAIAEDMHKDTEFAIKRVTIDRWEVGGGLEECCKVIDVY